MSAIDWERGSEALLCICLIWAGHVNAADCIYKDVMTEAEISACRDALPAKTTRPNVPTGRVFKDPTEVYRTPIPAAAPVEPKNQIPQLDPKIGMTAAEAKLSLADWCFQPKVNRTTNALGVSEQWVCAGHRYLYFRDGVLTSIQE